MRMARQVGPRGEWPYPYEEGAMFAAPRFGATGERLGDARLASPGVPL